jgi:hypothetical protein
MGKFVILPSHPSNDFFAQFPNCLTYTTKEEFVGNLYYALTHAPEPLTEEYSYALSWEAATDRLKAAACIPEEEAQKLSQAIIAEEAEIEVSYCDKLFVQPTRTLTILIRSRYLLWWRTRKPERYLQPHLQIQGAVFAFLEQSYQAK